MNKKLKKLLIFIAALVIVVVIVGAAELLLNKKAGDVGPAAVSPSDTAVSTASASPSPSESASASPTTISAPVKTEKTVEGTKYTVTVQKGALTYAVVIGDDVLKAFSVTSDGDADFALKSADDVSLKVTFVKDKKAETLAPSFLDSYIKYNDFDSSGQNYIVGTKISGETVTGSDGTTTVTAVLVDTDSGVLAFVSQYASSKEKTEKPMLDKILSTLVIGKDTYGS